MIRIFAAAILSLSANAQTANKGSATKPPLQTGQLMTITYGSVSWNTDSKKIDSAFLLVRDKNTQKIATIQLEETEPDSSQFRGKFSVAFVEGGKVAPEVYIPPTELRREKDVTKLYQLIQTNQLTRKPVILRKTDKGPVLDVYDTRDQAERALKAYQDEIALAKQKLIKPLPSEQDLDAAKMAQMNALALEAAKRDTDRVRLDQIERQRHEKLLQIFSTLSTRQKDENRKKAKELAEEGLSFYKANDFVKAEESFRKASDLDPEATDYYYKYGVSLYRNNKLNEALVILKIAKDEPATNLEKKYYIALIHLKLKEYNQAIPPLQEVSKAKDPVLSPSALFYLGVVYFETEKYEEAKKPFEEVIDVSSDSHLDQAAENYLDLIAQEISNKLMREKKWTVSATVGGLYDSNVTLAQTSDALNSVATDNSDVKLMMSGSLQYCPLFTNHHEWAAEVGASAQMASKAALQYTDPWIYQASLPYSYKGLAWGKGYKLTLRPGYDMLYMGQAEGDSSKTNIMNSIYLSADNTFVMRKNYFASYFLEYRNDTSSLASSIGPNDLSATKISAKTTHSFFLDNARKEAVVASGGLVLNDAKGDNKKYNRVEVGVAYLKPIWESASLSTGLSVYRMNYGSADPSREDQNATIDSSITKAWTDKWSWTLAANYAINNSTVSTSEYSKLTVMSFATFNTNF